MYTSNTDSVLVALARIFRVIKRREWRAPGAQTIDNSILVQLPRESIFRGSLEEAGVLLIVKIQVRAGADGDQAGAA